MKIGIYKHKKIEDKRLKIIIKIIKYFYVKIKNFIIFIPVNPI
jgi:hypothetical protein